MKHLNTPLLGILTTPTLLRLICTITLHTHTHIYTAVAPFHSSSDTAFPFTPYTRSRTDKSGGGSDLFIPF